MGPPNRAGGWSSEEERNNVKGTGGPRRTEWKVNDKKGRGLAIVPSRLILADKKSLGRSERKQGGPMPFFGRKGKGRGHRVGRLEIRNLLPRLG